MISDALFSLPTWLVGLLVYGGVFVLALVFALCLCRAAAGVSIERASMSRRTDDQS